MLLYSLRCNLSLPLVFRLVVSPRIISTTLLPGPVSRRYDEFDGREGSVVSGLRDVACTPQERGLPRNLGTQPNLVFCRSRDLIVLSGSILGLLGVVPDVGFAGTEIPPPFPPAGGSRAMAYVMEPGESEAQLFHFLITC